MPLHASVPSRRRPVACCVNRGALGSERQVRCGASCYLSPHVPSLILRCSTSRQSLELREGSSLSFGGSAGGQRMPTRISALHPTSLPYCPPPGPPHTALHLCHSRSAPTPLRPYSCRKHSPIQTAHAHALASSSPDNPENEPYMKWLTQLSSTPDTDVPKIFSTSYGEITQGTVRSLRVR